MSDIFKETNTISFGSKIKNSIVGVLIGIILFIASIIVLWCNEGNYAKQIQIADYINKNAVPTDSAIIDRINDGKLITTFGSATTKQTLSDDIIAIHDSLVMERTVEMYQWIENKQTERKDNMGGSTTETTTYSYEKVWSAREVDSSDFHKQSYVNPHFTIKSARYNASEGRLGEYKLTETQTSRLNDTIEFTNLPQNSKYKLIDNYYYQGTDFNNPKIGDIRISYSYIPSGKKISVVGKQNSDNTISQMYTKKGNIYIQYDGTLSLDEILYKFRHDNSLMTNIFRILGFVLMCIGLNLIKEPIAAVLSVVPVLSNIFSGLTFVLVAIIALILSLLVIAIAWLFYRPLLAAVLIAVIVYLIMVLKDKLKK